MAACPLEEGPRRAFLVLFACFGLFFLQADSASAYTARELQQFRFDPRLRLTSIETDHFRIHYAAGLAASARHLAALSEATYVAAGARIGWRPKLKTDVVLVSDNDRASAFTITFPTTQIFINETPPLLSQGIQHYGDWLRWLLVHEYTHVVQLDRVAGLSRILRSLFGTFARPNMVQPPWLKEGLAVLLEGQFDTKGRGDSSTYRMMLRAATREGALGSRDFGSLESAAYQKGERWPWLLRTYLWGSVLVGTLEQQHPGRIPALVEATARGVPGLLGPAFERAGLPSPRRLQDLAVSSVRARAVQELEDLGAREETAVTHLTTDGYNKFGPVIDPTGTEILYVRERPQDDNAVILAMLDPEGNMTSKRELFRRQSGYQLSYARSGRFVAFDDLAYFQRFSLFSDLFLFDRDTERFVARSRGLRGRDPDVHPDGLTIAFVRNSPGGQSISLSDSGFGDLRVVYEAAGRRRLAEPRWSPDGSKLVFMEHDDSGGERLLLWTRVNGVEPLTDANCQNRDPAWSPDGRHLLFSSDRTGTFQVHALELLSRELRQVTHRYGGAFWPVPDPRARFLFFLDYSNAGFDLVRMPWRPEDWWSTDEASTLDAARSTPIQAARDAPLAQREYSSWPHMRPLYLQPSVVLRREGAQIGLTTGGIDPAFYRHYRLSLRRDGFSGGVVGQAFFYDGRRKVPWTLEVTRDVFAVEEGLQRLDTTTVEVRAYVALSEHQRVGQLQLSLLGQRYERGDLVQKLGGARLRFERDLRVLQPNELVPESGSSLTLQASELLRARAASVALFQGHWERPLRLAPFGPHSVLTVGAEGAWVAARQRPQYFFYAGGEASLPFTLSSTYRLSGYEPNALAVDRLGLARVRFTRPLARLERGFATFPAYFDRISMGLRAESGLVRMREQRQRPWSIGAELLLETRLGHLWPTLFTLGIYRGDPKTGGGTRVVLTATPRR